MTYDTLYTMHSTVVLHGYETSENSLFIYENTSISKSAAQQISDESK